MCKTVKACRESSSRIPRAKNGLEAWIFKAEKFGTYGVRFCAPGEIFPGYAVQTIHDGMYTAVEKL